MFQKAQKFFKSLFRFLNSATGLWTFLVIIFAGFFYGFVFVSPDKFKEFLQDFYSQKPQKILSQLEEPVEGFGTALRVTKLKRNDKIYLNFLVKKEDQSFRWINSVPLKGHREAFFDRFEKGLENSNSYPEVPGSLLITWSDHNTMEIVAPTFDSLFVPVLNKVIYNKQKKQFELSPFFESYSRVKSR